MVEEEDNGCLMWKAGKSEGKTKTESKKQL